MHSRNVRFNLQERRRREKCEIRCVSRRRTKEEKPKSRRRKKVRRRRQDVFHISNSISSNLHIAWCWRCRPYLNARKKNIYLYAHFRGIKAGHEDSISCRVANAFSLTAMEKNKIKLRNEFFVEKLLACACKLFQIIFLLNEFWRCRNRYPYGREHAMARLGPLRSSAAIVSRSKNALAG